jgi:hypothetical protein
MDTVVRKLTVTVVLGWLFAAFFALGLVGYLFSGQWLAALFMFAMVSLAAPPIVYRGAEQLKMPWYAQGKGLWLRVFVGICVLSLAGSSLQPSVGTTATSVSTADNTSSDTPTSSADYRLGDTFTVGKFAVQIKNVKWLKRYGSFCDADSDFLVITLKMTNVDSSPSTIPPFEAYDSQGNKYNQATCLAQGVLNGLETINPKVSKQGTVLFDLPRDKGYEIAVPGGYGEGSARVRLD